MKISVITPVKNEVDFIGYSAMAVLPYIHEILYGVAPGDDNTLDLLYYIKNKYAGDKLKIFTDLRIDDGYVPLWDFNPMNMEAYNESFNYLIRQATGDAVWFLHPDMIVTNPEAIEKVGEGPLAWWTNIESYAGDLQTRITAGRATKWKNIQANQFGLHYFGGYGSQNEDFYFSDITGKEHRHFGEEFEAYPFDVADSGINVNHYCELKTYPRRLEKMKRCLTTLMPNCDEKRIAELAANHPRVTLEQGSSSFGQFEFTETMEDPPDVFVKYHDEFKQFIKPLVAV